MNTPVIWILFPLGLAVSLYLIRRWQTVIQLIGILVTLTLAGLAWQLPIGQPLPLGPLAGPVPLELADTLTILGRRFVLDETARPVLIFVYLGLAFWFGGARLARTDRLFIPAGLAVAALLVAALAVEPFLYAALLIVIAALVCVPLLSPPGHPTGRGVLRFLVFQLMGMPFLLFAGWLISSLDAAPASRSLLMQITVLLGLGFAFFSAIFPFHTWIPMLAEESNPYAAAFVFFLLPGVVSLFGLEFLTRYTWLGTEPLVADVLRFMGAWMVVTGGVLCAFQRNLARMLGFAVIFEIGLSLLALSLASSALGARLEIFFALLLPRGIGLGTWALALSILLSRLGSLSFSAVFGLGRQMPLAAAALLLAHFSIAGFPLLAGFPVQVALWEALAGQSLPTALLSLLGAAGLLAGGIRCMAVLFTGPEDRPWEITESAGQSALLVIGLLAIFALGLLPQWFLPPLANMAHMFAGPGF